jgi:hypothetical protein
MTAKTNNGENQQQREPTTLARTIATTTQIPFGDDNQIGQTKRRDTTKQALSPVFYFLSPEP